MKHGSQNGGSRFSFITEVKPQTKNVLWLSVFSKIQSCIKFFKNYACVVLVQCSLPLLVMIVCCVILFPSLCVLSCSFRSSEGKLKH